MICCLLTETLNHIHSLTGKHVVLVIENCWLCYALPTYFLDAKMTAYFHWTAFFSYAAS